MATTYDALMSLEVPDVVQRYTVGDSIIYALGIGLGFDPVDEKQLQFVSEEMLKPFPTLPLVLAIPSGWVKGSGLDYSRVVHGEQSIELHKPLDPSGEVRGVLRIADVIDKGQGKGALVYAERHLTDTATGARVATLRQTIFARGDGGIGGTVKKSPPRHELPTRRPDGTCTLPTIPQQALIYRLSGDYNPLHIDPNTARRVGFDKPILHGLSTFGVAAHALLRDIGEYKVDRLNSIAGRFTAPVYPGESLETDYWIDGEEVGFRCRVAGREAIAIDNGRAVVKVR